MVTTTTLILVWIVSLLLTTPWLDGNAIAGGTSGRRRGDGGPSPAVLCERRGSSIQYNNDYGPTVAAAWRHQSRPIINATSSSNDNDQINDNFLEEDEFDGGEAHDRNPRQDSGASNDKISYYQRCSLRSTPIKRIPQLPQPRKNELWLPWPLGAMRNDFYRYAAEQQQQQQQQRRQNERSSNAEWREQLQRGTKWVTELIDKAGEGSTAWQIMTQQQRSEQHRSAISSPPSQQQQQQQQHGVERMTDGTSLSTASRLKHTSWFVPPWGIKKKVSDGSNNTQIKMSLPITTTTKDDDRSLLRGGDSIKKSITKGGGGLDKTILFQYLQLQASVRLRQLGYVGSDFSIHLPPASPVLLFYFCLPSKVDPIRRLVKYVVAGATLSWMHSEGTKYRRFSPLPVLIGMNVRAPDLPPFLPEMETMWPMIDFGDDLLVDDDKKKNNINNKKKKKGDIKSYKKPQTSQSGLKKNNNGVGDRYADDNNINNNNNNNRHHHPWEPFQSFGSFSSIYRTWVEGQSVRNIRSAYQRRIQTSEQLLTLQKNTSSSSLLLNSTSAFSMKTDDAGYALVTGASSGIGRAISVELARYHIPLILVARDISKLKTVANDIERHYNIKVKILQADLSTLDCASRIYDATKGLNVDILVNNAGVCTHGDFVDGESVDIMNMMSVNMGAVTHLSQLYGRDMKERRRGRILIVSSISGALPGNPNVAVYAATKAYEKSFALSLGREMERYGVGVTCLLPGAVKDTNFASRSDVEAAACFHIPGYAKTPEFVAGEGIKALMMGYPEIYPGAVNRMFVKAFMPMLPPRFSTMIGEMAWNPWQWGDVMPQLQKNQRRGRSIISHANHNNVYAEPDEIYPPLQSTLPPVTSTKETLRKFQLPDLLKSNKKEMSDGLVSCTEVEMIEQIPDTEPFKQDGKMKNENILKGSTKESDDTKIDRTIGIVGGAVAMKNITENKVDTTLSTPLAPIDNESNTGTNTLEEWKKSLSLPPVSATSPNVANLSTPLTLLDCIDQGKEHKPSSSSENLTSNDNDDGIAESQQTWLRMMDSKDYDFRDRTQSY